MTREEEIIAEYESALGHKLNWENKALILNVLQWADEHPKSPWISVEDRLPEKINKFLSESVLCRYTRGSKVYYHVSQYDYDYKQWQIDNVTHWMPIPELKGE